MLATWHTEEAVCVSVCFDVIYALLVEIEKDFGEGVGCFVVLVSCLLNLS